MSDKKLDIFNLFANIDRKKRDIWQNLSEEERKAVSPLIIMRWLSGTTDARQIIFLNTFLNPLIFHPLADKELLLNMMTICTSGKTKRYNWIAVKAKTDKKSALGIKAIKEYFGYSTRVASDAYSNFGVDDFVEMAEKLGWEKQEIKDLKKQVK